MFACVYTYHAHPLPGQLSHLKCVSLQDLVVSVEDWQRADGERHFATKSFESGNRYEVTQTQP